MIALIGGNGYVGGAFRSLWEREGVEFRSIGRADLAGDFRSALASRLSELNARHLVNCAGYTGKPNVDACERDKANCLLGNAVLPGQIAEVCSDLGIRWGHVSSGCVFSGERPGGGGWREDDAPNFCFRRPPCSFYSGSKALGEEALGWSERPGGDDGVARWQSDGDPGCFVWRLRIPFSELDGPRNYLSKLQRYERLLEARNSLSQLDDFAAACWQCLREEVPFGIYNVTNPGSVTTSEVVERIRKHGVSRKEFHFFESEESFMKVAAIAPRSNCVLDSAKLSRVGIRMRSVDEALDWSLAHWRSV